MKFNYLPAIFGILIFLTFSCTREDVLPENIPDSSLREMQPIESMGDDLALGVVDCQVVGPTQSMANWQPDLKNLFENCHEEQLPGGCVYFGNNTQTVSLNWPFYNPSPYDASAVNVYANHIYTSFVLGNRPSPAENWLVYKINVLPANYTSAVDFTMTTEVIYRYYSCPRDNTPGLF